MVVDRIVAVVGERLVLQSEVELEEVLGPLEGSSVVLLMGDSADPLQVVIDRAIIRGLAGTAAIYIPTDADIRARVAQIRANFPDDAGWERFLQRHGLEGDRLTSMLYSRLVVDRYILRNVQSASNPTTYSEWIAQHRARIPIRMVPRIQELAPTR